jgi:hypothetical protein
MPTALLIESSDYAICYCPKCREKYFDREFQFVRQISDDLWRAEAGRHDHGLPALLFHAQGAGI